jgi:hypothetical protein
MIPICSWKSAAALTDAAPMTATAPTTPSAARPTVCSPVEATAPWPVAVPENALSSASDFARAAVSGAFEPEIRTSRLPTVATG